MHAQVNRTFVLTEAFNTADNRKRDAVCSDSGYQFSPFSMTTLGGFSVLAKWVIDYLAVVQRNFHGGFKSEYSAWIRRRLEFLVMKFQASACALRGDACGVLLF